MARTEYRVIMCPPSGGLFCAPPDVKKVKNPKKFFPLRGI